ncbi:peptidase S8 [Arenimonas terrae]|uniref:Peptidase S8 n=1 Tax=Arenimonas terrae TaxID=2546226 RepID=A0A5C4RY35_9GAMM|nr:peptidase S8 [Arenimonas terrae]
MQVRQLLREHRKFLDTDPRGAPVVRGEVVAIDPTPEALQRARDAGFRVRDERRLEGLGLRIVVLQAREGQRSRAALKALRRLDPSGSYDFNHLYLGSGTAAGVPAPMPASAERTALRVGLVDTGVDAAHPALAGVRVDTWGCGGAAKPHRHGTAVASLLVGSRVRAAPARHRLYAADIYCGRPTGGAVTGLAEAFAWLAQEKVAVVNLSLVGPPNQLLERGVQAMLARGHVLVAAVGNDGPAAPPLYPAAYPGVIGVTAVDARDRVLPEAGRGEQVDFAAPGAGLSAAGDGGGWWDVRGTSFAAPLVARLAGAQAPQPSPGAALRVQSALAAQARDAGPRGDDARYGRGLLGGEQRARWSAPMNED